MNVENQDIKEVRYQETLTVLEEQMRQSTNAYATVSKVLNAIVETVYAEVGTLWFYDRFDSGFIIPRATCGRVLLDKAILSPGEGVAGKVVESGKAIIVADCQNDPRWAGKVDAKTGFTTKSMLCVPLSVKGTAFGCIQIINKTDHSVYDEMDLKLVSKLAQGISEIFFNDGLLNKHWLKALGNTKRPAVTSKITFNEVFGTDKLEVMEERLRSIDGFKALNGLEQMAALAAAKKLWKFFGGRKK